MSSLVFVAYRQDKQRAEKGHWRVPETVLHAGELLGGWPGALIARQYFRHKTAKAWYRIKFWAIVLLHQLVAFEAVIGLRSLTG